MMNMWDLKIRHVRLCWKCDVVLNIWTCQAMLNMWGYFDHVRLCWTYCEVILNILWSCIEYVRVFLAYLKSSRNDNIVINSDEREGKEGHGAWDARRKFLYYLSVLAPSRVSIFDHIFTILSQQGETRHPPIQSICTSLENHYNQ